MMTHRDCAVRLARALCIAGSLAAASAGAALPEDLLPPERAFAFSGRALDERTVEARFAIARGYYLYRDKLQFSVQPAMLAAAPVLPAGKIKDDEFFGRVETFRGELVVRLALDRPAAGERVLVEVQSQGCADAGVCYPPQVQSIALTLPAPGKGPGPVVEANPARKSWFK